MINWPIEIIENKYSRWYEQLINKARNRGTIDGYTETHHVIPRSLGGDNTKQNLVELTAREHYVAHALLWKMKLPGVAGSKMAFAFNTFISRMHVNDEHSYTISSRIYESFRIHYANILRSTMKGSGNHFYGKKHSEETRRIIGEKSKLKEFKRGPEHFNYGKPSFATPEGKERQRAAIIERWNDPDFKTRVLEQRKQVNLRPEVIAKRKAAADAKRGVKKDPAHTAGMRAAVAARKGKKWEEIYTTEQITRMHEALKNRVLSEESKAKMSFKGKGKGIPKVKHPCPHCGKLCAGNMLAMWHGNNCKSLSSNTNSLS